MITYEDINYEKIHCIKPLWERNRVYHEKTSLHFGTLYQNLCFEDRMQGFAHLSDEDIRISIAKKEDVLIGYCLSTCKTNGEGELASLHVLDSERGQGIGEMLTKRHLKWMAEKNCQTIEVTVSHENEATIEFYKKMGFLPNTLQMRMK